jgi:hypothetical protein
MQSARVWRSDRMIERQAARMMADRAADAAAESVRPAAAEPAPMLIAARPTGLLNSRHIVPAPEAPRDRENGGPWIV